MCYMNNDLGDLEFEDSFPTDLRKHATAIGFFGGEFLFEKMTALEKDAVRKVKGIEDSVHRIDEKAIKKFINDIRADALG